jgi:hypothetical protein
LDQLYEAESTFREALTLENTPATANIETKVHFYLGQINLVRAQELGDAWYTQAEDELLQVVGEYNEGNKRVEDWAGHAYARLGLIEWLQGDPSSGATYIASATELVSPYHKVEYYTWLAQAHTAAGERDSAEGAYQECINNAKLFGFDEKVEECSKACSSCTP